MCFSEQSPVAANFLFFEFNFCLALMIKIYGVFWVLKKIRIGLNPVRYIGVNKLIIRKISFEFLWIIGL